MPQNIQEGATATGPDGHKIVFRGGQWYPASSGPQSYGTPAPDYQYKAPQAQAEVAKTQSTAANEAAKTPYIAPQASADVAKTNAEVTKLTQDTSRGPSVDEARTKAISAYWAAMQLGDQIQAMRDRFKDGPGATSGIFGLEDYFPTTANQRFDTAANTARGNVGNAFGFTGGQLNTPRESEQNIGPYLPSSWDKDQVASDKMDYLQGLRDRALRQAVAQLGGIPDKNGRVTPVPPDWEPSSTQPLVINPGPGAPPSKPMPGASPERPDGSAPLAGGTSGGNTMSLSQGDYTTKLVDPSTSVQASFRALLKTAPNEEKLRAWGAANGYDMSDFIATRRKNPGVGASLGKTVQRVPLDWADAKLNKIAQSPLGAAGIGAGDAVSFGTLDNMTADPAMTRLIMDRSRAAHGPSTMIGNIAGGALAAGGLEGSLAAGATRAGIGGAAKFAPLAADAIYGAASGAGGADNGNRLAGAALGATLGAGGGAGSRAVVRGAGGAIGGVRDEAVRSLAGEGVPLTLGQAVANSGVVGKGIKGIEDAFTSLPIIGDVLSYTRNRGVKAFNRAAFKEGLSPIGAEAPKFVAEKGVEGALGSVGDAYKSTLGGKTISLPMGANSAFAQARDAGFSNPSYGSDVRSLYDRNIAPLISPGGTVSGEGFQSLDRSLDGYARKYGTIADGTPTSPPQPGAEAPAEAFAKMGNALDSAVNWSDPSILPQYQAAKGAYRNTMVLKDAVNRARNGGLSGETGVFMPSQLSDAAAANARVFGGGQGTTNQPFFNLTRDAQGVLPSKLSDSGTAKRLLINSPLFAAAGGGYASGNDTASTATTGTLGTLGALSLLSTPAGQRLLTGAVLKRPEFLRLLGSRVENAAPYAGILGTPTLLQLQQQ
jgi:hypothetical protein